MNNRSIELEATLRLALEALENPDGLDEYNRSISDNAITVIKEALQSNEQLEPEHSATHLEPVAFELYHHIVLKLAEAGCKLSEQQKMVLCNLKAVTTPYVATPLPQRQCNVKPLTIDQIASIAVDRSKPDGIVAFVRAIEAAHGIKE